MDRILKSTRFGTIPRIGRLSIKADEMTVYIRVVHNQVKKAIEDSNITYKVHMIASPSMSITSYKRGRLGIVRFCKR
jgi:hypothetical protein